LKLARDAAAAFSETPESRRWMAWTNWLSRRAWSVVILLGTGLLPLAAACWWLGGGTRLRRWVLPVAGCGFLLATMGYLALGESADVDQRAVVIRPATVRISPFAAAESKGSLAPGKDVRLGQERDGWFQVVAASGLQGWVSAEEVAPLIPR
ncbi:MAG: SH3 domain-containing protein, partial [Verrucomicrobiales bacterium]|nr:SH3 domain-containing protein [Verrucomicrobiales bacterium]